MIRFACPACRIHLKADDCVAGATITCPSCQQQLLVPGPSPDSLGSSGPAGGIPVNCPGCGRAIQLAPHDLSRTIVCARCNTQFVLSSPQPAPAPAPAGEPLPNWVPDADRAEVPAPGGSRQTGGAAASIMGLIVVLAGVAMMLLAVTGLVAWLVGTNGQPALALRVLVLGVFLVVALLLAIAVLGFLHYAESGPSAASDRAAHPRPAEPRRRQQVPRRREVQEPESYQREGKVRQQEEPRGQPKIGCGRQGAADQSAEGIGQDQRQESGKGGTGLDSLLIVLFVVSVVLSIVLLLTVVGIPIIPLLGVLLAWLAWMVRGRKAQHINKDGSPDMRHKENREGLNNRGWFQWW